jgi:hypothetical protein
MATTLDSVARSMTSNRLSSGKCGKLDLYRASASSKRKVRDPSGFHLKWWKPAVGVLVAVLCAALLAPGDWAVLAQSSQPPAGAEGTAKIPNDQLDSLVAPIALYPDPLLSQTLVASTYPLEIIQLQQWLERNKNLKDKELEEAVKKQDWDPSIQAMALLPDVAKRLAEDIKWTTDLGNAFLAQQADVMDAVQRMRKKAQDAGNLKSTEQQKVETQVVETKTVVVIEQANPQVVYVPTYNPVVVYGPPVYPYPPIYYPPPSYYAAGMAISFGVGVAMGAAMHGGWGYNCGWGHNDVEINVNNNYVSHYNKQNINNVKAGNTNWQHNPQHRGGAPYPNQTTAKKYGGTARGDSMATRQANARRQAGQMGGRSQAGSMDRNAASRTQANAVDRSAGGRTQATAMDRSPGGRSSSTPGGGSGDRIGSREVPRTTSAGNSSAFTGASSGAGGSSARASSMRGASSMGASRGGGRRR